MKLAIICPKCSFRITSDLEHAINSGVCPKCGTEIEALKGENKENIGVIQMFISACKELDLPLTPQQILDLINKFFKEKSKLALPDFELDIPVSQKLAEMEASLGKPQGDDSEAEEGEDEKNPKPKPEKKPKKVPKMKQLSGSSTAGIPVSDTEAEDMLKELEDAPLVPPPTQEDYGESGFSFGSPDPTNTQGRSTSLNTIRQRIQQYKQEE